MYRARPTFNRRNTLRLFGMEGSRFVLFDFETTGLDTENDRPVQIAALTCQIKGGEAESVSAYSSYIRQPVKMGKKASEKNGITDEMLAEAPDEDAVFQKMYELFGDRAIVCGYNIAEFDIPILIEMYKRHGKTFTPIAVIDVCEIVRDIVPLTKDIKDRTQQTMAELYGVGHGIKFHDACGDVEVCLRLLNVLHEEYAKETFVPGTKPLYVNDVYFWKGFNKEQQGIYVITQFDPKKVRLWYSTAYKCWCSAQLDLSEYDIDRLTADALMRTCKKFGLSRMPLPEFGRLTEEKFKNLKKSGK